MKRRSNFELMKIISMIMIIAWHFLLHGKLLENSFGKTNIGLSLLMCLFVVHVNSFVLITGYFQYNKKFKLSKIIQINNAVWFYKVVIMIIFLTLGLTTLTKVKLFQTITPINYCDYWFIGCYVFLYLSSPLLNIVIKHINKKQHRNMIIAFFLIISILSTITNQVAFDASYGYSIPSFIMLYFIGSYIGKYNINIFNKKTTNQRLILLVYFFVLLGITNWLININVDKMTSSNAIIEYFIRIINANILSYSNPLVVVQSIIYFLIFKNLKLKFNKIINLFASTTLGIYMIHDNELVRGYMYKNIFNLNNNITKTILLKLLIYVLIVFIICAIIEIIRKHIFKWIYSLRISKKIRQKIIDICNKNEISW